jgi:H+-transporting ATPase
MPTPAVTEKVSTARPAAPPGLTSDEAHCRLEKFGPNAMPDASVHPLRQALEKFWALVPWMLEAAIVLELALGKYAEASVIAVPLIINALGYFQESRAQATLAARLCHEERLSSFRAYSRRVAARYDSSVQATGLKRR